MTTVRTKGQSTPLRVDDSLLAAWTQHLSTRPAHTQDAYLRDLAVLQALAGDGPLAGLSSREIRRFLATLHARGLSGRSLGRMLSAWRAFYRFAIDRDPALEDNPCTGLRAPKSPRRLPSALSPDEAVQLVAIDGNDDSLTLRDRALFELAYSSGLRVSELAGLAVAALDLAAGEVRVWGKGAKERVVPVGAPAREALHTWLARRPTLSRGEESAVFLESHRPCAHGPRDSTAARGLGDQARTRAPRASAYAATFVCVARAAVLGRPAGGAGAAGARKHREHADLHAPRFPGAGENV